MLVASACIVMFLTGATIMQQNMIEYDHPPPRRMLQSIAPDLPSTQSNTPKQDAVPPAAFANQPIVQPRVPDPVVASPPPQPLVFTPLPVLPPPLSPLPPPPPPFPSPPIAAPSPTPSPAPVVSPPPSPPPSFADQPFILSDSKPRPQLLDASGRVMGGFGEWLKTDVAMQPSSDAEIPVPAWIDKCIAALSLESSLSEQIPHKRAAWSLVGDRYLHFGAGKRFLLHLGVISMQPGWANAIRNHEMSPSSEWILWADIAMGACALGFELVVVNTLDRMSSMIHPLLSQKDYRWILTDYDGLGQLETSGYFPFAFQDAALAAQDVSLSHHCNVLVADFFGTSPEALTSHRSHSFSNFWPAFRYSDVAGMQGTGSLAASAARPWLMERGVRRKQVLVWGKFGSYFSKPSNSRAAQSNAALFAALAAHFTDGVIVAMKEAEFAKVPGALRPFITRNAGSMPRSEFLTLLRSSLVLLGIGEPLDGLSALEAMALGTVFINPRRIPAFKMDPNVSTMRRAFTSQHVYVEQTIKPPLAYTIDVHNPVELAAALADIDLHATEKLPILPPEFYADGFVHNLALNLLTAERDCDPTRQSLHVHPNNVRQWSPQERATITAQHAALAPRTTP